MRKDIELNKLKMPGSLKSRVQIDSNGEGLSALGIDVNGVFITEPYRSECSRFEVTPDVHGLSTEEAAFIEGFNEMLQRATLEALNAGCLAVQEALGVSAGDFAGVFFSDDRECERIRAVLAKYALQEAELNIH